MTKKKDNKSPLTGINILDLTNVLSGPFATLILAELGANVIKVEKPAGDDSRRFGPFINGRSAYFISLNRGKKSIVLNLKNKKDKETFSTLLSKVDVLVDNYKPGVLEKYGFTWKYLSKKHPKLIHSKISGFGESGPYKNYPAYDIIVQAMGGLMSITGNERDNFVRVGSSIGDIAAGLYCVIGILSQIIWRKNNKRGSKLDLSMLDCQIAILENAIARFSVEKQTPYPLGTDHPSIAPFGVFKTQDSYIALAAGNDKIFGNLCCALKLSSLRTDPLFKSNLLRIKNLSSLRTKIESRLIKKSSSYWIKNLSMKKIPCSFVNNIKDLMDNPQIKDRNMILDYNERGIDELKVAGTPLKFNFIKEKKKSFKSPRLDQNRNEILKFFKIS